MAYYWFNRLPPCPYCHHKWGRALGVMFIVLRPDDLIETVVQCPCRKSGIVLRFQVSQIRFVDIEGAKHYGVPEEVVRTAAPGVNRRGKATVEKVQSKMEEVDG